jgi:NitT/TauT family transport system substrate-binding protein
MKSKPKFLLRLFSISLAIALILAIGQVALTAYAATQPIRVTVDGANLSVDTHVIRNRVMLPYREIAERLGANIEWDSGRRSVTMSHGGNMVILTPDNTEASINGRALTLEVAPIIRAGRIFVPLRFLANGLGWRVEWRASERTVALSSIPPVTVNVAVPEGVPALGVVRMLKERPAMGANITVNYEIVRSPDLLAARVVSGDAHIAVVPTNLASVLHNRNTGYRLAASTVWGVLYIVSNENITSWNDLRGKTIHTFGRGLTPDIVLRYLLAENGFNPERDVTLNYLGSGTELAQAMIAGRVNTAVLAEPAVTQVLTRRQDLSVALDLQKEWGDATRLAESYPQASIIISGKLIDSHPEFVERFLQEVEQSVAWVIANPRTAGLWAEELQVGIAANIVERAMPRTNIRFVRADRARRAIDAYLKVLFDFAPESIGGRLPGEEFYYKR